MRNNWTKAQKARYTKTNNKLYKQYQEAINETRIAWVNCLESYLPERDSILEDLEEEFQVAQEKLEKEYKQKREAIIDEFNNKPEHKSIHDIYEKQSSEEFKKYLDACSQLEKEIEENK